MTMPADPNAFHADGTPRRRYEIEETESGKPILRSSIGLVFINAFIVIKSMLYAGENPKSAAPAPAKTPDAAPLKPAPEPDTVAAAEELGQTEEATAAEEETEAPGAKGSSTLLTSEPVEFEPVEVPLNRRSSGLPSPSNDNEALYGASPGSNISIFRPNDTVTNPPGDGGGGGQNEEDPDDPNDDGDDDDDPVRNRAPVILGPVALSAAFANTPVTIALADLLRNADDPDGDVLRVRSIVPSSGKIERQADGNFVYTPVYGDTSSVSFTYFINDGTTSVRQTAFMDLVPPKLEPIYGTATADTILGTPRSDTIYALGGDDLVIGRESGDVIYGGDGDDRLLGSEGDDVIYGEGGKDVIFGGPGNDSIFGGADDDQIFGEEDKDTLLGETGNDTISGGDDNDVISGGEGDDDLHGDAGNDVVMGDAGEDKIKGGDGDDSISGGDGADAIAGDAGNDAIWGDAGTDNIEGGEGDDSITAGADADVVDAGAGDDTVHATILDADDIYNGGEGT
ncbi:MAG: cadherin-like domain-containing protein, partial [Hyphomicrobium sp.]